ncbi:MULTISPECIES: ATP-dependent zinc metalloprotease FtsH [Acidobacterium]|uniref:ATP-dependent zinc metalloprotease FtsH n=1 Tax=Acidobacterium capsulatum (strain ATCC 51196 / DSM 11244 / BCRC 80197 / JCM 7670 / NBRC 15755 / NCIMB 13165 / 161) TaxID=240015 RepID=FTSH_ACIC5|nr:MULTISPECIES: ATP-dependent zinc metalloprotease FtsH [Acidobacterium]C1F8X6.1 RecName: Full=ATP-dependent zinc metalloprotease FtsH [Acidobacterium capsulatum ATCC 51196]ACO33862.1 ATP-dependent metalloprotease FtsH [Acidobacterium capsulatum ATCC 51196]HCT59898.1 ATP-dependent zinc metalloprotease FtsH [Acidobacterium sp.]
MNSTVKTIVFWVFILACCILLWQVFQRSSNTGKEQEISFSQFLNDAQQGQIHDVTVVGGEVHGHFRSANAAFHVEVPTNYPQLYDILNKNHVAVTVKDNSGSPWWSILIQFSPVLVLVALWFFMIRQMQSGGNKALSFGKSRARLLSMQQKKVTFKDVAGVDEAKEELKEIIEFLREAQKFQKLGGRIPKGVLLVGPPGTGKTLLARAVAGEANVPFFSISGSDFVEMFVGVGASRVRDLFEQGKKNAPCIIFIDEIDAVGRHRGAGLGGGHDEREQTLNQLLVEMDGFEANDGVILVAATNRPDVLDPALLRPGRFDRRVVVGRPDVRGREEVLRVHAKKVPLAEDVDLRVLARGTPGFSGADLANMVNEGALSAARANRKVVTMQDFESAKDKVLMGAERKSMLLTDEEKRVTAYHESGHAIVAAMRKHADPLHKVTIIPRGMALGVTMQLPEEDKHTVTKDYLETQLAILMGGRIAEEIFLHQMTTGAGNDIERATEMARKMVCEYGMSRLGPLTYGKKEEQIFLGREIAQHRDFSEETARQIDAEVRSLVDEAYRASYQLLNDNQPIMHKMAAALLERETIDANDIRMIIEGKDLPPLKPSGGSGTATTDDVQQVLKPSSDRGAGGLPEGSPSPA